MATAAPTRPQSIPSMMNGRRTNQFVAPTSFITSISRRLEWIERRIVFAISSTAAIARIRISAADHRLDRRAHAQHAIGGLAAVVHRVDARPAAHRRRDRLGLARVVQLHLERGGQRVDGKLLEDVVVLAELLLHLLERCGLREVDDAS